MTPLTRSLRTGAVTAAASTALLVLTGTAALAADDDPAEVEIVAYDCTSIDASSSKAISNVVLAFADGDTQRFEGLPESRTGTFAGTGDDSGEVITTAWIKSGDNKSGDGPGYGERFDFDTSACDDTAPSGSSSVAPTDDGTPKDDGPKKNETPKDDDGPEDDGPKKDDGPKDDDAPEDDAPKSTSDDDQSGASTDDTGGDTVTGAADAAGDESDGADDGADDDAAAADQDAASAGAETPATSVLGAVEQREAGTDGLRAADASDVRSADVLPNTGSDTGLPLAAALAALILGGALLRRTSRSPA